MNAASHREIQVSLMTLHVRQSCWIHKIHTGHESNPKVPNKCTIMLPTSTTYNHPLRHDATLGQRSSSASLAIVLHI